VVNAGGIINISVELTPGGYDEEVARTHIEEIVHALEDIYAFARSRKVTTAQAANAVAERVLEEGHRQKTVAG
jgi:glutamate dehydrogenase/leucine dehydrogenase